jgi:hypothetical protein
VRGGNEEKSKMHHGAVRFCHFKRLLNNLAILIGAVNLPTEHLGVDLDLLTRPSYETCSQRGDSVREQKKEEKENAPEAIRLSLNAAIYHSQVFLISVKHTIASSEMYIEMSPSNLICLARFLTNFPLAVKNVSLARSPCPSRRRNEAVRTTPDLRMAWSERSLRRAETRSEVRWSSLARKRWEAWASPAI